METEKILLDYARSKFDTYELQKILNLKKKDQLSILYGAGLAELLPFTDIKGKSDKINIDSYIDIVDEYVRRKAFRETDWGRKQNINLGKYKAPIKIKNKRYYYPIDMRIEDVRRGKFTSREYYADYSFWFDIDNIYKVYYSFDGKVDSFNFLELWKKRTFVENSDLGAVVSHTWGGTMPAYEYKGEEYHIDFRNNTKFDETEILNKLRKRYVNNKVSKASIEEVADKVYVTLEDSLDSGNCKSGTLGFIRKKGLKKDTKMRGDKLLKLDNNLYTRRAILTAYEKSL